MFETLYVVDSDVLMCDDLSNKEQLDRAREVLSNQNMWTFGDTEHSLVSLRQFTSVMKDHISESSLKKINEEIYFKGISRDRVFVSL